MKQLPCMYDFQVTGTGQDFDSENHNLKVKDHKIQMTPQYIGSMLGWCALKL